MTGKRLLILTFLVYVLVLFLAAVRCEHQEQAARPGSWIGFGLIFQFILLAFAVSTLFLILASLLLGRFSLLFAFAAPMLLLITFLATGLAADFLLWITQTRMPFSSYQKLFLLATSGTTFTTLWCMGDSFQAAPSRKPASNS